MIDEILNETIFKEEAGEVARSLRMSDAGKCIRQRILKLKCPPPVPYDARQLRLFWLGHKIHEHIQEALMNAWGGEKEIPLKGSFLDGGFRADENGIVSGHADYVVRDDGGLRLYEFKSVSSRTFQFEISDHYLFQIYSYTIALEALNDVNVNPILVLISRDTLAIKEIPIPWDLDFKDLVVEDWQTAERALQVGEIPVGAPRWDWECDYCLYSGDCPENQGKKPKNSFQKGVKK